MIIVFLNVAILVVSFVIAFYTTSEIWRRLSVLAFSMGVITSFLAYENELENKEERYFDSHFATEAFITVVYLFDIDSSYLNEEIRQRTLQNPRYAPRQLPLDIARKLCGISVTLQAESATKWQLANSKKESIGSESPCRGASVAGLSFSRVKGKIMLISIQKLNSEIGINNLFALRGFTLTASLAKHHQDLNSGEFYGFYVHDDKKHCASNRKDNPFILNMPTSIKNYQQYENGKCI